MVDLKGSFGSVLSSQSPNLQGKALKAAGLDPSSIGGQIAKGVAGKALGALNKALFNSGRRDPDIQFSFYVEINGIQTVKFTECNGIEWSVETESFFEGGNNRNKVHLIGQGSFKPLVLKKGFYSNNGEFFNWLKTQQDSGSSIGRTNIALVVSDDAQNEVCRFQFFNAFCSRYQGPSFNAKQSEIAFEEVEIIYDWFEMKPGDAFTQMLGTVVGALL